MIYSDRQYKISRAELTKLKAALASSNRSLSSSQPWLQEIESNAFKSQIAEIEAEIAEYDLLKRGQITFAEACPLSELPRVLVQARIAKGLSQTDLAQRLDMKPQQVQRYEATNYMSASLARLIEVAQILDVKISESFETAGSGISGAVFSWSDVNDIAWSRLPLKEMISRKWFAPRKGEAPINAVRDFFLRAAGPQFATALHRKKVRSSSVPNEYALLAWQARVLDLARATPTQPFELNDRWLGDLVRLTRLADGPKRARDLLAKHGIALVFERHLAGTYLDGAAMLSNVGQPVIGMTLRYDRLDNFWFVLFHELGHVLLHLFDTLKFDFFDEEDGKESDELERAADRFALDTLIPPDLWDQCLSRFALTEEAVKIDAQKLDVAPSIIAGRIRKERNNYMILNEMVGNNTVRALIEDHEK